MLSRISFSWRLLAVALLAALVPIIVAYLALVNVPHQVASNSLDLALRETMLQVSDSIRETRADLVQEAGVLESNPEVSRAIINHDRGKLNSLLSNLHVNFSFDPKEASGRNLSPIYATISAAPQKVGTAVITHHMVLYRPITPQFIANLQSQVRAPFAITYADRTLGKTTDFPTRLSIASTLDQRPSASDVSDETYMVTSHGTTYQVYVSIPTPAISEQFKVLVVSTPQLEQTLISGPRNDILRALLGLALVTVLIALVGIYAINRSIRRFGRHARDLAVGDYQARMPVHGNDAFAQLAGNFNTLAHELEGRLGQLKEASERYARTIDAIEEGVCLWHADGSVLLWNSGAEKLTGVTRDEAIAGHHAILTCLRDERNPGTRRVTLPPTNTGHGLIVDLVVTPEPNGSVLQTFRDITAAEVLQQTRRNFMATAAHEIRTPLTTILGFSETLTNDSIMLDAKQQREFLTLIHEQAQHLGHLTDAFFTSSQLANERVEVSLGLLTLNTVVDAAIERTLIKSGGSLAHIEVDVAPHFTVFGDERALVGVVSALIENAHKYGKPPIRVAASGSADQVFVTVRDAGGGIDSVHYERIFDPFYRIDPNMRSGIGGAGLGLFTARKLVRAMRGDIHVFSSPDDGTTFTISLPSTAITPPDSDLPDVGIEP